MLKLEILVFEALAVDGFAAGALSSHVSNIDASHCIQLKVGLHPHA